MESYEKLCGQHEDLLTLVEMAIEENDESAAEEIQSELEAFKEKLEAMKLETLLTEEYDANNAILTFHAGAGGTEAQDWVSTVSYTHLSREKTARFIAATALQK